MSQCVRLYRSFRLEGALHLRDFAVGRLLAGLNGERQLPLQLQLTRVTRTLDRHLVDLGKATADFHKGLVLGLGQHGVEVGGAQDADPRKHQEGVRLQRSLEDEEKEKEER